MMYLFSVYQRIWHWLQALVLLLLIFSGLEIHLPERLALFGFAGAVRVHNVVAFILLGNAFLGFFYYVTTGEIRQLLPQVRNILSAVMRQVNFYAYGQFHGAAPPHRIQPEHRLNPLQRVAYTMVLNVLLPLQAVTGLLIWSAQAWPDLAARLGGLATLAAIHSLGAWLFCAFTILHLYLITTGHTPTAHLRAMVTGWEPGDPSPREPEVLR